MIDRKAFNPRFTSDELVELYQALGYKLNPFPLHHDPHGNPNYELVKQGDESREVAWFSSDQPTKKTGMATFDWLCDSAGDYHYTHINALSYYDWLLYASRAFGVSQKNSGRHPGYSLIICAWPVEVRKNPFHGKLSVEEVMITLDLLRSN